MSEYLRVLVVHRQKLIAGEIKEQFDSAGWSVHLAHNGLDGLQAARRENYGMIVTAFDLPVITGIEMIRAVRNFSLNVATPAYFTDTDEYENYDPILKKLNAGSHSFLEGGVKRLLDSIQQKQTSTFNNQII